MRILLIQLLCNLDQPSGYIRTCYLEPIGLEYLASVLKNNNHYVKIEYGKIETNRFKKIILKFKPDIICFSVYTYTFERSLKLAQIAKRNIKNIITIFGGYHPTAMPEIVTEPCIDYVIIGEGEKTILSLISSLKFNLDIHNISGIAYMKENIVIKNKLQKRIKNINSIPLPIRSKKYLKKSKQYQISYPSPSKQISVAQVIYSRGCLNNCSFCSSESMWGKKVYWRNPIKVVDEIEYLHDNFGTNLIYFPDLTFNTNLKKVIRLCREIIRRNLPVHWWALFRIDNINQELLYMLKEAKCVKLSFGIESVNVNSINKVKDNSNYNWRKSLRIFEEASNLGFIIKAFLMIGYPWEDINTLNEYKYKLKLSKIDELRVTFITPFPSTKFYNYCNRQNLIKNTNFTDYTTEEPIIYNSGISKSRLKEERINLIREYYLDNSYINQSIDKIKKFPYLANSWNEYFKFLILKKAFKKDQIIIVKKFIKKINEERKVLFRNNIK